MTLSEVKKALLEHGVLIGERRARDAASRGYSLAPFTCYKIKLTKSLKVYKRVISKGIGCNSRAIATLSLPVGTLVIKGDEQNTKLRASEAKVLSIVTKDTGRSIKEATASYDNFKYVKGTVAKPRKRFNKSYVTCGGGIHFFLSRAEAAHY